MNAQVDVICCKSVGTDLSMLDIEDFITEICQLKKEVASLEAKLRERGDKLNREDVEEGSVRVSDGTEAQDSVWSVRDQRSRDTQDSELSLTLLCYTDAQDHESTDQISDCNAGEQQMKMCSVKLVDCRNLIESRAEKQQQQTDDDDYNGNDEDDDEDFIPPVQQEAEVRHLLLRNPPRAHEGSIASFLSVGMLSMKAQVDVICCKSVGTDLSMLDIEDFIIEICQLKKEVASLEAKLRERGDKLNREDVEEGSVCVSDGTEAQDSVWSVRDQRSRDTQDSELSLTLLCYTDAQDHESTDQTSDCNAGEQQMKMCSVKLVDCRNLIESRAEKQQQQTDDKEDDDYNGNDEDDDNYNGNDEDDGDFIPPDDKGSSSSDGETALTSKEQLKMLSMKAQVDVICCKSVGTDLSMLDIEDFITEICQLKKEVASLEAKLRERGDKQYREDVEEVSVRVSDGTEAQDSVWSVRDQRSRDTQDSELSLTLLCYTDAQDHESTDQTSDCNAGEQQMKMCSVKLVDCRNLIESRAEKQQQQTDDDDYNGNDEDDDNYNGNDEDDGDFIPPGLFLLFMSFCCFP
ncbi:hypothetical protein QQF64_000351 [Cirrhinus molitorella]|uniref:Uncharacterized protein n=1 Tax=Cirrhinus molitorella TaxID=172907 RepID=A0ABR3NWY5_9TELE